MGPDIPSQPVAPTPHGARALPSGLRIVIIGGSTAAGLGVHGHSFAHVVADDLPDSQVLDLSEIGRMLDEHLAHEKEIREFAPDVALICAGMSESMVHPGPRVQHLIEHYAPASWHGVSGLQARPYYSTKRWKRTRQRLVSKLKVAVKRLVIRLSKGRSRMSPQEFGSNLSTLFDFLEGLNCQSFIVDLWRTDERLFPGSDRAFQAASDEVNKAAAGAASVTVVPVRDAVRYWDDFLDDHLHWNETGHRFVADLVLERLAEVAVPQLP